MIYNGKNDIKTHCLKGLVQMLICSSPCDSFSAEFFQQFGKCRSAVQIKTVNGGGQVLDTTIRYSLKKQIDRVDVTLPEYKLGDVPKESDAVLPENADYILNTSPDKKREIGKVKNKI